MKRTFTINLNNFVYNIDDDAYETLQKYFAEVESFLSEEEKKEVMADIESRIAELFSEKLQKGKNVINIDDVNDVINILGKPNQYADGDETTGNENKSERRSNRKFYRDPDKGVLGGVAAGLSALLGWDITLVRVLFVVLVLVGAGVLIPIYILVWLIAPAARTTAQRLEMQGESVTADRIKEEFNNAKTYVESDKFKDNATQVGKRVGDVFKSIFKIFLGVIGAILGFIGIIVLGALIIALIFVVFEPGLIAGFNPQIMNMEMLSTEKAIMLIISLILVVGAPIFMLVYWAIRVITGKNDGSKTTSWVVLILWLAGLFMFAGFSAQTITELKLNSPDDITMIWDDDDSEMVDEMRIVSPYHSVNVSGNIELIITQDSVESLQISAQPAIIDMVKTEVKDGVLHIYTEDLHLKREIKVTAVNKIWKDLQATGASSITASNSIVSDKMKLNAAGASRIDLNNLQANQLNIDLSGVSMADLTGKVNGYTAKVSGVSKLDADGLVASVVKAEASGASEMDVDVTDSLWVTAYAASKIDVENKPRFLEKKSYSGSDIKVGR